MPEKHDFAPLNVWFRSLHYFKSAVLSFHLCDILMLSVPSSCSEMGTKAFAYSAFLAWNMLKPKDNIFESFCNDTEGICA